MSLQEAIALRNPLLAQPTEPSALFTPIVWAISI